MLTSLSKELHVFTPLEELPPEPELVPIEEIERGRKLRETIRTPGWKEVLDILDRRVMNAENATLNYKGFNRDELSRLQGRSRAMRELFQETQIEILTAVDAADQAGKPVGTYAASIGTNY